MLLYEFGGEGLKCLELFGILMMWRVGYGHFVAGVVYVDHAGATLHADSQLKAVLEDYSSNLYGNPRILLQFPELRTNCFKLF
jgi:hypothetical protein